jgi:alkylated DNA repair protein alkB homolog 8
LNIGIANGISTESLVEEVTKYAELQEITLIPMKSYCFLRFKEKVEAEAVYEAMNGKSEVGQNNSPVLMGFCEGIPVTEHQPWRASLPEGLILIEDCITAEVEEELLGNLVWDEADDVGEGKMKNRKVQHFGFEFLYGVNNVDASKPLMDRPIPEACSEIWKSLENSNFRDFRPDQLTVNRYETGHGIPAHCDTHSCFEDPIVSLSLGSSVVMEFRKPSSSQHSSVFLPRRSLLVMSGESRFGWTHGITPKKSDVVTAPDGRLTVQKRELRVSFTFRKLKIPPSCSCSFPSLCDVAKPEEEPAADLDVTNDLAAKLEIENVHKVYNEIGSHFSETRHSPWPNVESFINGLADGAILLDIGCGNGKYLKVNENVLKFGCDRSDSLLQVCSSRKLNVFQCDCLEVPFRDASVDAAISIAVIHHLATRERRIQAINEMVRVLVPGGTALIYVWAKDQQKNNKKSTYLLQHQAKESEKPQVDSVKFTIESNEIHLPVHKNRTQFKDKDVLVPWKLKQKEIPQEQQKVFLRYYHVFEDGELEKLCRENPEVEIVKSYYDQGNHCVILKKTKK